MENNKQKIDTDELKWIIAIKDNRIEWHYEKYYGDADDLNAATLVDILFPLMVKTGAWKDAIEGLYYQSFIERNEKNYLKEWLWKAIKLWCNRVTVKWLNENAASNWRDIVEEDRHEFVIGED